jgi:hypothetical protein
MEQKKPLTHTAWARKREGRTAFRWLEVGVARIDHGGAGEHDIYVDRLPIGGFTGHIILSPLGSKPPEFETQPSRPGQTSDNEEL